MLIDKLDIVLDGIEKSFAGHEVIEKVLDAGLCYIYQRFINSAKARGDSEPEASALLSLDHYLTPDFATTRKPINNDSDFFDMQVSLSLGLYWQGKTENAISHFERNCIKHTKEYLKTKAIESAKASVASAERSRSGAAKGGNSTGASLKAQGKKTRSRVLAQAKRLTDSGTERRFLAGIISQLDGMPSARHVRAILKNAELKGV